MKKNVLIIGAGGVAHVVAHKAAQHNTVLGNICIASRTVAKCEQIIDSIHRKNNLADVNQKLYAKQVDASQTANVVKLIQDTQSAIVINVATNFINMPIMDACLEAGAAYIDTAVHEDIEVINAKYPWYAEFEWRKKALFKEKGLTAILGAGFDPGVVNAYCAYALKHEFDKISVIDIMDVNAGDHGKFFATNFDPEINLREILENVGYWEDRQWQECGHHAKSKRYDFPVVGEHQVYLMGHDEIHSLSINLDVDTVRFWMGFSEHYINCFNVLKQIGLLNHNPITTAEGLEVVPLKVVKACLPDPASLAPGYTGKTCIGNLITGEKDGKEKRLFIYNICDHEKCYQEVEAQAISYTAGVPAVAAAILIANGEWDVKTMMNVEELNPDPFINLLNEIGLPTEIRQE